MASTPREFGSAPLTRDELLDAPLHKLRSCALSLGCHDGCTKPSSLSLQWMAAAYGRELQLKRVLARLRCSGCRRRQASAAIYDRPTDDAVSTWCVVVLP